MNLSKIHHIAIIVSDYEAAKDFYVNKLGFSVIRENYRPERKDWSWICVLTNTQSWRFCRRKPAEACEPTGGLWAASPCILCGERGADSE